MPLPTRVLEALSEDGMPALRLYETKGQPGQYSTLSYCWGGEQHYKLVKARLEAYKDKIEESCLPQTVKDAIYVTRRLRIRYLWIDAYCIIQDSTEDKSTEIGKMASIYKNAFLAIQSFSPRDLQHPLPISYQGIAYLIRRHTPNWVRTGNLYKAPSVQENWNLF
jgi:hypothetical protein